MKGEGFMKKLLKKTKLQREIRLFFWDGRVDCC